MPGLSNLSKCKRVEEEGSGFAMSKIASKRDKVGVYVLNVQTPPTADESKERRAMVKKTEGDGFRKQAYSVQSALDHVTEEECEMGHGTANGRVSTLVNFFDQNKNEVGGNKNKPSIIGTMAVRTTGVAKSAELHTTCAYIRLIKGDFVDQARTNNNDSSYVVPSTKSTHVSSSMESVITACVSKSSIQEEGKKIVGNKAGVETMKLTPPTSLFRQMNISRLQYDIPASRPRNLMIEPPGLAVVVEEDAENNDFNKFSKTCAQSRFLGGIKQGPKDKRLYSKKIISSSSSSSSGSSLKSAASLSCLLSSGKKVVSSSVKNGPTYGSVGNLVDSNKSKHLEEAEKRREELLQQKVENSKRKWEEWTKKKEKIKLEKEKRLQDKQIPSPSSSSLAAKKPLPIAQKTASKFAGGSGFPKPRFNFGPSTSQMPKQRTGRPHLFSPVSQNPGPKPRFNFGPSTSQMTKQGAVRPQLFSPVSRNPGPELSVSVTNVTKMDSPPNSTNSILDESIEGPLCSYDITLCEDWDEDLKHRENKTVPTWASDKETLNMALFSMVLLQDYEGKLCDGFPKPDKSYTLFPNSTEHK